MPYTIWFSDRPMDVTGGHPTPILQSEEADDESVALDRARAIEEAGNTVLEIERDNGEFIGRLDIIRAWDGEVLDP